MKQYKLSEIITLFGGVLQGEDITVSSVKPMHLAQATDITFVTHKKYKDKLASCLAGAIIINQKEAQNVKIPAILSNNPYWYFSKLSALFYPPESLPIHIHQKASIDPTSVIGDACAISENVVIGAQVVLGSHCQIYPNVIIGKNVVIGNNVIIHPNVTIYSRVTLGDHVVIHAGAVIGSDGFGYAEDNNKHWSKIRHIGGVVIGNDVEIGANTTIDSGTLTPTVIEDGVIIDNLVQIAHNDHIGAHTAIAGLTAIAGSTKIGKHCRIGGGCGINGHIEICDYTVIGGETGVSHSITKPDLYFGAYPAMPYKEWARTAVYLKKLEDMYQRIKALEAKMDDSDN